MAYQSPSASPPAPQYPSASPPPAPPVILLEDGWNLIYQQGLLKLQQIIQRGLTHQQQQQSASAITLDANKFSPSLGFTNEEYARLYTIIYQMCIQKGTHCFTPQLYQKYEESINEYLENVSLPAIGSKSGEYMIREVVRRWEDHQIMGKWMYDFFRYLDRFYVKRHGKKSLKEVSVLRFRALIFDKCKSKLTTALLEAIKKDRNGEEIDRELLQKAVSIYVEMGMGSLRVYQQEFERSFLQHSREYYAREAAAWITSDSCPEYLRKCEKRFQEERKRISEYLIANTEASLIQTLNDTLLMQHQKELLEKENTGVRAMLKAHSEADLMRLYSLYANIPSSLPFIASMLQQHIVEIGNGLLDKMNNNAASSAAPAANEKNTYIEDLMKIHETYFELVRHCFGGNAVFQKAMKEAFETIINKPATTSKDGNAANNVSSAELLSIYADDILRKGGIQLEDSQVEKTLDSIVRLFSYLIDKDLFSEFYRKQLATRLLTQRSANSDAEKNMIGKIKMLMGGQFTSKLEGMFNDMRNSNSTEHLAEFQNFIASRHMNLHGIDFTVQTLTMGNWPSYPMDELKLPKEMQDCLDCFRVYYDTRTNNRKLGWIHDLGVVTLGANFPKRRLDLVVSTVQATVLMQFNESEELSIDQLIQYTQINADLMKQTLKSLVSGKFKILVKTPTEGYSTSHKIKVNQTFTSAQFRVRIPNSVRKIASKDRESASAAVTEDRKHAMEANIVRIMKARKVMNHMQLMTEVSQQLMHFFQPDPRAIKQRIEDLILREYMKRDEEKPNVYHYLA